MSELEERLRALCRERQAAGDGRHGEEAAAIWPEEILAILDDENARPPPKG